MTSAPPVTCKMASGRRRPAQRQLWEKGLCHHLITYMKKSAISSLSCSATSFLIHGSVARKWRTDQILTWLWSAVRRHTSRTSYLAHGVVLWSTKGAKVGSPLPLKQNHKWSVPPWAVMLFMGFYWVYDLFSLHSPTFLSLSYTSVHLLLSLLLCFQFHLFPLLLHLHSSNFCRTEVRSVYLRSILGLTAWDHLFCQRSFFLPLAAIDLG